MISFCPTRNTLSRIMHSVNPQRVGKMALGLIVGSGLTLVGGLLSLLLIFPAQIIKYLISLQFRHAGCAKRFAQTASYKFCYYERGQVRKGKTSMVFVHGFASDKDMWYQLLKKLPEDIHVVFFDLLGHGDSSQPSDGEDLGLLLLTHKLHEAINAMGVNSQPFHLLGTSMGGAISGLYSHFYPDDVAQLTLMCPLIRTPVKSEFMEKALEGDNALLVHSVGDMRRLLELVFYAPEHYPSFILWLFLQIRIKRGAFDDKLYQKIRLEEEKLGDLGKYLNTIEIPTQVLWGQNDKIIDPSGAELVASHLRNCSRIDTIERCGHGLNMDRPGQVAKCLLQFRGEYQEKSPTDIT